MATMDVLPHIPLDHQLAVPMVHDTPLGGSHGRIPVQLCAGMWKQAICHEERGGLLQGVEE